MFKIGDKVRVINDKSSLNYLSLGDIKTVKKVNYTADGKIAHIMDHDHIWWNANRFELVNGPDKVDCVITTGTGSDMLIRTDIGGCPLLMTYARARKKAEELAIKNPTRGYTINRLVPIEMVVGKTETTITTTKL